MAPVNYGDPKVCLLCGKKGVDPRIGMCEPGCGGVRKFELYGVAAVLVAVFLVSWLLGGCVTLSEAERRERAATCGGYKDALEIANRVMGPRPCGQESPEVWAIKSHLREKCGE